LLEGLEISEITLQALIKYTISLRFDSEYFRKEYLAIDKLLSNNRCGRLASITSKIDVGFVGSMTAYYRETGVTLIQTKNINSFFVDDSDTIKITDSFHKQLRKSQIYKGDILIARSGSFGKAAIYLDDETINSSDIIIIKANEEYINPFYLTAFLNSNCGINQMIRFASGGLQGHVNLTIIEELVVPLLRIDFQKSVERLIFQAHIDKKDAIRRYQEAETLLLETLGLYNFEPTAEAVNIKSLKESFLSSGRLDAEYYQKKYEEITVRIKLHKYDQLGNLVDIKKSIEPGSDAYQEEGVPFIRVSNLNKMGLSEPDIHLDGAKYKDVIKPRKDTILLSKDGSVGIAYKVTEDMNAITSGAILHLSVKTNEVLPDYLTLVLNSKVVQMQAERDAGGSILQHWKPSEIAQVEIPIIDKQIQQQIASLVSESFALKKQSEQLLETAKRAVEIAIEDEEENAFQFIENAKKQQTTNN